MTYLRVCRGADTYYLFADATLPLLQPLTVLARLVGGRPEEMRLCRAGVPLDERLSLLDAAVGPEDELAYQVRSEAGYDAQMRPVYTWA